MCSLVSVEQMTEGHRSERVVGERKLVPREPYGRTELVSCDIYIFKEQPDTVLHGEQNSPISDMLEVLKSLFP